MAVMNRHMPHSHYQYMPIPKEAFCTASCYTWKRSSRLMKHIQSGFLNLLFETRFMHNSSL